MPLDALTVSALTSELKDKIEGGKIDKVQQPGRDLLLVSLRSKGESLRLLIAAGTGNARVHLTKMSLENPAEPPMFCMLLRKHLVGARIVSVRQPDWERMVELELDTHDELGVESRKRLVIELIGRSSNVILVGQDGRIIECMRRMDFAGDAMRRLLPGMIYRYPPKQDKLPFFTSTADERRALIAAADMSRPVDKWLLDSFSGLSPLVCRELSYRCGGDYTRLPAALDALLESVSAGELVPTLVERDGKPFDFSAMSILQYGPGSENIRMNSFSEMLDAFYSQRDLTESRRRRSSELTHRIKTARDRVARKLAAQRGELARTEDKENVRVKAELVTGNIYRIKKGDRTLECGNYYEPDCPNVLIELDPLKTPQQNAAALYKEYSKLKGAEKHLGVLVSEGEKQLEYLSSVLDELERAESERDVSDIRRELSSAGFLRAARGGKQDRSKPQAPLRFVTDDGLEVLVGRSNVQNDELTTKLARRTDYWFHTQKVHGSHVILRCDGLEPPETSVEQAAKLAAYFSQARIGGKTAVDYTMVRFVRKPSGALPGKVLYTDFKTIVTEADEALAKRLAK